MTRPFTGRHMLTLMIAFFGLIIAVNFVMARYAVATFGGEVVENSYVASQRFNGWLASAHAQDRLGWRVSPRIGADGVLHVAATDAAGCALTGRMTVTARHPLGRVPDQTLALRATGDGFVAGRTLPGGRWLLRIDLQAEGHDAHFEDAVHS